MVAIEMISSESPLQEIVGEMALRATDAASGWIGKMSGIQHGIVLRALREQALSRGAGFSGILIGEERDVRPTSWIGWWTMSPINTARDPPRWAFTTTLPGEWPAASSSQMPSSISRCTQ